MNKASGRSAAVLVGIALIAVGLLVGCGGEQEQPTTTSSPLVTTSLQTTTTDLASTTSTQASGLVDGLPVDFVQAWGERPIVVLFYVPGEVDDEEVVHVVRELRSTYPTYTFLIYDFKLPDVYGDLADLLLVSYQPYVALIDRHGIPQRIWSGFVDKGSLNQTLIDLGRY